MSEKLHFTPVVGYRLTELGLSEATDDWNNVWSGRYISCANDDPSVSGVRQAPSPMTISELFQIHAALHPFTNPLSVGDAPKNTLSFLTTGTVTLGALESPLQAICQARREQGQEL